MKKGKKWGFFDKLLTGALIVVTLLCFTFVVQSVVVGEVSAFGFRFYYVATGSMEPEIPIGSLIVVKEQDGGYEVGDVITFYSHDEAIYGMPNTHRIVAISVEEESNRYQTKGDANNATDYLWTAEEDVIGLVVGQISASQWIAPLVTFATTSWGFLLLIICPLMLITMAFMRDFVRAYQEQVRQAAQKELEDAQADTNENQSDPEKAKEGEEVP